MRLNRGTIALIVVALIVIGAVAFLNNNQAAAPGAPTPTVVQTSGALWQGLDQASVSRLEVRDNHTGQAIVLGKASNGGWDVVDSGFSESMANSSSVTYTKPETLPIDTSKVNSSVTAFAGLQYADHFDSDTPADFGLDKPLYTIYATTSTNAIYAIHVGNKNPNNTRYYVTIQQLAGASATAEAGGGAVATEDVRIGQSQGPGTTVVAPSPAAAVTDMVGADPTLNALATQIVEASSEAEITEAAVALSTAVSATNAAVASQVPTQATPEMTAVTTEQAVMLSTSVSATNAATTPESTSNAVATQDVRIGQEQGPGSTVVAPTAVSSAEATAATAEATFSTEEATAIESTAEATPVVLAQPLVELTGKQTVYLLPMDVIGGMVGFLQLPPYIYPTATPTLPPTANPYSEVQQTATAAMAGTMMQSTMESIISTATARAVTPEATGAVSGPTAEVTSAAATAEATP